MSGHAAIYARISRDPQGRQEGVEAQEKWGRTYCAKHWPDLPVELFTDNDISAADPDAYRPEYERFREWVRQGKVAQVWAVERSRLTRWEDWFTLAPEMMKAGIDEVHTQRDGVVVLGSLMADILAVIDIHEVRKMKKRIVDKKGELARQGRPAGNYGFGYRHFSREDHEARRAWRRRKHQAKLRGEDMDEWKRRHPQPTAASLVDDKGRKIIVQAADEAAALREAAKKVLNGWTLTKVANDFNDRGLFGDSGGDWTGSKVRYRLTSPTVAGFRVHRGEIVGRANWEPILDETTWRAVRAKLRADRTFVRSDGAQVRIGATRPNARKGKARQHLLTAVAACAVCNAPLSGTTVTHQRRDGAHRRGEYICHPVHGGRSCVRVPAVDLEEWVCNRLLEQLDNAEFVAAFAADDFADRRGEIVDALSGVEARRLEVTERWNAHKLTTAMFDAMNEALIAEERALNAELASLPTPMRRVDPDDVRTGWSDLTFDERRQVIVTYIARVVVDRRWKGTKRVSQGDVAEAAEVSKSTVRGSMFSDSGNQVSDATRARVLAVAAEIGYDPGAARRIVDDQRVTIRWRRPQGG